MDNRHSLRKAVQPIALTVFSVATAVLAPLAFAQTQVFIVQTEHQQNIPPFQATHVNFDQRKLTPRGRRELIVAFTAEQGFARRPLPLDTHGLVLHANGPLKPAFALGVPAPNKNVSRSLPPAGMITGGSTPRVRNAQRS